MGEEPSKSFQVGGKLGLVEAAEVVVETCPPHVRAGREIIFAGTPELRRSSRRSAGLAPLAAIELCCPEPVVNSSNGRQRVAHRCERFTYG